ncbi:MAG: hypothetical protein IJX80_03400 [Clostridia bacterium]|nr:hypothetical protein [Clostridia bacterium]
MKYQFRAHRGGSSYTPENTMPAFIEAVRLGFEYIETDPQLTRDGVLVLMHDSSINRTCRNADGSAIDGDVYIKDLTYEELLQYDAGIRMGEKFKGTKIPTLDELLAYVEGKDVIVELDKKVPTAEIDRLIDVVLRYKAKVSFLCADIERIQRIQSRIPDANILYEGVISEEMLQKVTALVAPEHLIIGCYLDLPNFAWLEESRKTSTERCALIKKYGRLSIGNVNHTFDVRMAMQYDPDIIEI